MRSLREMSDECGLSASYLSELERGVKTEITRDTVFKLAGGMGVSTIAVAAAWLEEG